jgi:predicted metal-dependent peptidase
MAEEASNQTPTGQFKYVENPSRELQLTLDTARYGLYRSHPFFGAALARVDAVYVENIETAMIDGTKIYINPTFWLEMTPEHRLGVLAHEIGHMLFGHLWRRGRRDHQTSNIAMDYALNLILIDECGLKLPDWVLYDKKWQNMAWEEVYDKIMQENKNNQGSGGQQGQNGQGQNQPGQNDRSKQGKQQQLDSHGGWVDPTTEEGQKQEQNWKGITAAAAITAKRQGKMPAGLDRFVSGFTKAKIDWYAVLYRFLQQAEVSDESWSPPDRRFVAEDDWFPAEKFDETLKDMYACFDTSGSMGVDELQVMCGSIEQIMKNFPNTKGTLMVGDAAVHYEGDLDRYKLKSYPGGGGTDFRPFFKRIADKKRKVSAVIFFTDGYGSYPEEEPPYPVIWCITGGYDRVPWGVVVHLNQ